jgi:mannosyltransferase OCH1-like enzyme
VIPKKIWQTYQCDYDELPEYIKSTTNTWIELNPDYEYQYMSDNDARDFIKQEYGNDVLEVFNSVPVGVMRGDMWRYLIIYAYGGVYTDLDTRCNAPISSWIKEDKRFIICPENDVHLCQWTFAATAKHPSVESVINLMLNRLADNPDWSKPHFVHYYTGPGVWTQGIVDSLGVPNNHKNISESLEWNNSKKAYELGFYCYGGDDWLIFHKGLSSHLYGSQNWSDGYEQWIKHPLTDSSRRGPVDE